LSKKTHINDLAIAGGVPAFESPLHVGHPVTGNREGLWRRINDLLDRRRLTNNGPYVRELEEKVARLVGVKHCVAMCNGTVALEIAVRALDLTGEVIVPSFTFVATAHALQWQGITPIFCDIDPNTHTIDPDLLEQRITPRTTGFIGVHLWGSPCDIERLSRISQRHNLKCLFDAAHAFACSYQGRMIGNFGHAEVFSFHATKFINTFEGGAVVTNDDDLASRIRLMRNFGFDGYDNVVHIGTNGKMSEVAAAMGLTGLESMGDIIAANFGHYRQYQRELKDVPGIKIHSHNENERCNYQYIVLEIDHALTHVSRDDLIRVLHSENILARRYFFPGCHRMEPYRTLYPEAGQFLPATEKLTERVLCLPTGPAIGTDQIEITSGIIRFVVTHGEELTRLLSS
jgi:dTDP-4-amino-4,6-dideoxygalactose transaminase